MKKTARLEDQPKTLIFVDILGFAAITNEYKVRVQESRHKTRNRSWSTEMQNRINRFNTVLDHCVFEETLNGGIQAMLFSDCAFLVLENSLRAALVAVGLMQNFIKRGVPVRMGIGRGTFYNLDHTTRTDVGTVTISKSRFIGTAVVRAHAAEQCGGKGMRIFLDESVEGDLPVIRSRIKTLQLAKPRSGVKWELDYLYESRPAAEEEKVEMADRELFEKVARLKDRRWPRKAQRQYTQTLAALNRMRIANSRVPVKLSKLKYGGSLDMLW